MQWRRPLLAALVLVGACHRVSSDSRSGRGDEDDVSQRRALPASATLADAIANRVQNAVGDQNGQIQAAIRGESSVGDDGSARYGFPIWVPDGINGLQPELSIDYDSTAGTGLLGPRWRLAGLAVITRCSKTRAQDGVQTAVDFFGDTFCLDGQRLIGIAATSTNTEFRTERDSYAKIVGWRDGLGDFERFDVFQRDGRILRFGSSVGSRLHGRPTVNGAPANRDANYAFYVDKVEDRFANSIKISYMNSTKDTGADRVQELQPGRITWGPSAQYTIDFDYEPLPGGVWVNPQARWVHGLAIGAPTFLLHLNVVGPTGDGTSTVLKSYNIGYDTRADVGGPAIITGDRVLTSISECDTNGVCKRPTQVRWTAGSVQHTRQDLDASGSTDFAGIAYTGTTYQPPAPEPATNQYGRFYRRIIAADVDSDGLDDIVYRGPTRQVSPAKFYSAGWSWRRTGLSDNASAPISSAAPVTLTALGSDSDPQYRFEIAPAGALGWPGDIVFADVDGDGYSDIISPVGKTTSFDSNGRQQPILAGFRAYLNKGVSNPGSFGLPINFLDSIGQPPSMANFPSSSRPEMIGLGDIDGDGLPDLVRPVRSGSIGFASLKAASLTASRLTSKTETRAEQTFPYLECLSSTAGCSKSVPGTDFFTSELALVDVDGDGIDEVLRNPWTCGSSACTNVTVSSPTMSAILSLPASGHVSWFGRPTPARWFIDINGDGLQDIVWLDGTNWRTGISTGQTFTDFKSTTIPGAMMTGSWREGLPIDFNLDGRQDLLLDGAMTNGKSAVLLSDGLGGFTLKEIDNPSIPSIEPDSLTGRIDRIVADLNGDGLPDIVQLEKDSAGIRHVVAYVRNGSPPVLVIGVIEGDGRSISFDYDATVVRPGSDFYKRTEATTVPLPSCSATPGVECLTRGRWVAKSLSTFDGSVSSTFHYRYREGATDKHGRGFLGFAQRWIVGPDASLTTINYDHVRRAFDAGGVRYTYPFAMVPKDIFKEVVDPDQSKTFQTSVRKVQQATWTESGFYRVKPISSISTTSQCPAPGSAGSCTTIRTDSESYVVDDYGNLTEHSTDHGTSTDNTRRSEVENQYFLPADTKNWLVSLYDPARPSTFKGTGPESSSSGTPTMVTVTRTIKVTPDTAHGGINSIEIEPSGATDVHLLRTFARDASGRLSTITDREYEIGETRPTTLDYLPEDDGAHVSRITNPLGHATRFWRHPGYGFLVETDDPNGLAATSTYDTFGRLVGRTELSGASESVAYANNALLGTDVTITSGRALSGPLTIHLDASGRETQRTQPIDANRATRVESEFDSLGRLKTRRMKTGDAANPGSVANTFTFTYDGLDRLTSNCHLPSGGTANVCETRAYDRLTTTITNEAGRVTKVIANTLGDETGHWVTQADGTSTTARFSFGPFGVLMEERPNGNATGRTTFTWDVLGRPTQVYRLSVDGTSPGYRRTAYNAFGEAQRTWKATSPSGAQVEAVTYGHDLIGRVTSVTGSNLNRSVVWDLTYKGIGKVSQLIDGDPVAANNTVQLFYDASGRLERKTWSAKRNGVLSQIGSAQLQYDSQGAVMRMSYPSPQSFTVRYEYDPYLGDAVKLRNNSTDEVLWSADARNELGQLTHELMTVSATSPTVTRFTSYFPETGALQSTSLLTPNGSAALGYSYTSDGLPYERTFSSAGVNWSDVFGYDNLGQLTSWKPTTNVPVTFEYDIEGSLTRRTTGQGSEQVSYSASTTARTTTVRRNGSVFRTETALQDQWARVYDTPQVSITYNAADEAAAITTKATGLTETFTRDALGNRLETRAATSALVTLDDFYERLESFSTGLVEERMRLYANGRSVGELIRTAGSQALTATWQLADNVGNVLAESSASGAITVRSRRDPYGNLITDAANPYLPTGDVSSNPDGSGRMAFAGHARDTGWGLVDMKARLFSPTLGRFLSPDPIIADPSDHRDYNPFTYAHDMPSAARDPNGRAPAAVIVFAPVSAVGAIAGTAAIVIGAGAACYFFCADAVDALRSAWNKGGDAASWAGDKLDDAGGWVKAHTWDAVFGGGGAPPAPPTVAAPSLPAAQAPSTSAYGGRSTNGGLRTTGRGSMPAPVDSSGGPKLPALHLEPLEPIPPSVLRALSQPEVAIGVVPFGGGLGGGAASATRGGETLSRLGTSRESAGRLARKAAEAEEGIGIHGVSTTAGVPDLPASQAARTAVEKAFKVHNTPTFNDPLHRTIELPKPVTSQIADLFNGIFGRQ